MSRKWKFSERQMEGVSLVLVGVVAILGFVSTEAALQLQQGANPLPGLSGAFLAPVSIVLGFVGLHLLLRYRRIEFDQLLLPIVALLFTIGMIMIWRLRGSDGVNQQLRSFYLGLVVIGVLVLRPQWVERIRRWVIPISLVGLALPMLTALFGVTDETGARLALKLGPLPAIQTTEIIKFALVIFLAWYGEREGRQVEGRARVVFGWLRLPPLRYFLPGALFVAMATLALVQMSDFGAVLILLCIFIGMLYAAFETRIFITLAAIGIAFALVVGLFLSLTWRVPAVIQNRFLAFQDPWSNAPLLVNGLPSGITISQGPGYQLQQSIYAMIAGGLTGTGLGFGSPEYIPLANSDFIFAAILEEFGFIIGLAVLILFSVLLLRLLRTAALLPSAQVFERLLLIGIGVHLFTQVLIMVGGTIDLIPLTGITIPFLSQGGTALLVNMMEVGIVLALMQRLEGRLS